tara:strand:+ start:1013 stop:1561 length:549 start_codon:yes stop_codon:yes gene_type:complete
VSVFQKLKDVDISKLAEQKGKFDYLSWAHAVREMLKVFPEATWEVHEYDSMPYMQTATGYYTKVSVTIEGITRTQIHPVLDNKNQTIDTPNAFQINTSIQRCLAKAIALHGLGLVLFAGEDLPDDITDKQKKEITKFANQVKDEAIKQSMLDAIKNGKVNESNYAKSLEHCKSIIKNQKGDK